VPRYLVERSFPEGFGIRLDEHGEASCRAIVERNAERGVTWVQSYVSDDGAQTFCIYDAPSPEAVRATASANALPVDRITRVTVLDPYFYR
jgi:predicted amidohydrolase YtcJ